MEEETNQLCVVLRLVLEYGMVTSAILLHLSLSSPNFAVPPILYILLMLEYGMVTSAILLHLFLSSFNNPFASVLLSLLLYTYARTFLVRRAFAL